MGDEFRGKGANIQLGPGMNVARVPQCGKVLIVIVLWVRTKTFFLNTCTLSYSRPHQHVARS